MKQLVFLILCLVAALLVGCAENAPEGPTVEMWMLNVGKGDAIILQTQQRTYLIDSAKTQRWGVIQAFLAQSGITRLDGVIITHADNDHVGGLSLLAQSSLEVGAWYASGYSLSSSHDKSPVAKAAALRGQSVTWLYAGDEVDGIFRVLAPAQLMEDKEDNNSLVLRLESAAGPVLLTGDMEYPQEAELMARETNLACTLLKVANHGDDDTLSAAFLQVTRPRLALISTDPYEKPGTPDAALLTRLAQVGAEVFRTDMSGAGIHAILDKDGARAQYCPKAALSAPPDGLYMADIDAKADTFALVNASAAEIDLSLWYFYSSRGDEAFLLPPGTRIAPGQTLIVGSLSTKGDCDLIWNDKNVIHKSKPDTISLYDAEGQLVFSLASADD